MLHRLFLCLLWKNAEKAEKAEKEEKARNLLQNLAKKISVCTRTLVKFFIPRKKHVFIAKNNFFSGNKTPGQRSGAN